jgi:DNA-directed RNA polymerase specialized sigma24 family protein
VEDAVVAELLRGGEVRAVDAVYDYYANDLYDYALTLLDPENAADALHDALLVSIAWHNKLEARDEFGLWLYALVRNECLRVLRRGGTPAAMGAHSSRRGQPYERDDSQRLLREVHELVRHHAFDTREIATLLGVSAGRAQSLCDRSERLFGARRGAGSSRAHAHLPPELRARVIASAQVPSRIAYRGDLAAPRHRSGYPVPLDRLDTYKRTRTLRLAGAAAAVLAVIGAAFLVPTSSRDHVVGLLGSSRPASEVSDPLGTLPPGTVRPSVTPSAKGGTPRWSPVESGQRETAPTGQISGVGGKCMEVGDVAGAFIQIIQCNSNASTQRWTVAADGTIRALGKCLHVRNAGTTDGTEIQLQPCKSTPAQEWRSEKNGALKNPNSGRCLEAPTLNASDGTRLVLWKCSGADNQYWDLP